MAVAAFRRLFLGRLVSFLGNAFAPIALAFAVLDLTGSAGDLGLVLAARSLPTIAFLLVSGVWADRLPRHVLLVAFSALAAVTQAAVAALLLLGEARIWQLAVLEALNGVSAAFLQPASMGALPQTISPALLQRANALLRLAANAAKMLGSALAGLVVAAVGPGWGIAFDAATFLVAGLFFAGLGLPASGSVRTGMLHELAGGWREFRSRTWLWAIVVQFAFVNAAFAGGFAVLGPVMAERRLGGPVVWGLIIAAQMVGFMAGGVLALWYQPRYPLLVATYGVLSSVPMFFSLAVSAPLPLIMAAAVVAGVGLETFGVQWDITVQRNVPAEALSRVFAYDALGSFIFSPVGQSLAGPATVAFGLGGAIAVSAAVITAATVAVLPIHDVRTLPGQTPA